MTKKEICNLAKELNVPFKKTWTCYDPVLENGYYKACLECNACIERLNHCGLEYSYTEIRKSEIDEFLAKDYKKAFDATRKVIY
jgi:7-cyano-7-deazaguanine synthase in queuosine biosynthesis